MQELINQRTNEIQSLSEDAIVDAKSRFEDVQKIISTKTDEVSGNALAYVEDAQKQIEEKTDSLVLDAKTAIEKVQEQISRTTENVNEITLALKQDVKVNSEKLEALQNSVENQSSELEKNTMEYFLLYLKKQKKMKTMLMKNSAV